MTIEWEELLYYNVRSLPVVTLPFKPYPLKFSHYSACNSGKQQGVSLYFPEGTQQVSWKTLVDVISWMFNQHHYTKYLYTLVWEQGHSIYQGFQAKIAFDCCWHLFCDWTIFTFSKSQH